MTSLWKSSRTTRLCLIAGSILSLGIETLPAQTMAAARTSPPATRTVSSGLRESYADMVDRVAPAVVTIRSAKRARAAQQYPFSDDPMFRQFFGNRNRTNPREDRSTMEHALGSGVIVTADGYILTNHHVVDGAEQISVELNDRRTFEAKVIGSDAPSDLALLKVQATGLPVVPVGNSDNVRVGDVCLAVGNPLGIGETVTAGIISAKGRNTGLSDGSFEDFLQTDAAINQGNSGGALINTQGELIGINSQILSPSGGNIGIGFAIPSNMAHNVMDQLKSGGKVRRGKLGVGIQEISSDLAKSMGLIDVRGVLVNSVEPAGPAEKAGVRTGDVITAVNGVRVDSANGLRNYIAGTAPGADVTLAISRDGRQEQLHAHLAELSPAKETADATKGSPATGKLGITVEPLTPEVAGQMHLTRGMRGVVVTEVDPSGPAAEAGLQANDVILEVNHHAVTSAAELRSAVGQSAQKPALLLVSRDGHNVFLAVRPS